jgi:hypothetical protein
MGNREKRGAVEEFASYASDNEDFCDWQTQWQRGRLTTRLAELGKRFLRATSKRRKRCGPTSNPRPTNGGPSSKQPTSSLNDPRHAFHKSRFANKSSNALHLTQRQDKVKHSRALTQPISTVVPRPLPWAPDIPAHQPMCEKCPGGRASVPNTDHTSLVVPWHRRPLRRTTMTTLPARFRAQPGRCQVARGPDAC